MNNSWDKIEITDENRDRMKAYYLGGLCIAKQWINDAQMNGNNPEPFVKIFEHALSQFEKLFGRS